MNSISFPKMFSTSRTLLVSDHEATLQNTRLLLATVRKSLLGDPFFGTSLIKAIYEQNGTILRDLVIDEIYTAILMYIPQLKLTRNNISLQAEGTSLYATIRAVNLVDHTNDMFTINLTTNEVSQ